MSTDFYRVCQACLDKIEHYHLRQEDAAVHRWWGGDKLGACLDVDVTLLTDSGDDSLILASDEFSGFGYVNPIDLTTLGELRKEIGKGKRK